MSQNKLIGAGVFTAIAASLCCITPVLALIAGTGSIASSFSWIEPARPYLIGITIAVLGVAWYQKLKPQPADDCGCTIDDQSTEKTKNVKFLQSKSFLLIATLFAALMIAFPAYANIFFPKTEETSAITENSNFQTSVTFYKVPLVCNAAPAIGCGSRSKPVLLELEKSPSIREAWLNRPGTVIAIVWQDKAQTETVVKPIFEEKNVSFTELEDKDAAPYKGTFHNANLWYRGADVDMLSREEAATIAESAVKFALQNNLITKDEAEKIKADAQAYFKEELVKIRTSEQLNDDSQHKFKQALYNIAEKYIGPERAQKAMELYQKNCEKECKKDAGFTAPGIKTDCCKKPN